MPHQCTNCERTFSEGSTEMLSGCPQCGGNRFQFMPNGVAMTDSPPRSSSDAITSQTSTHAPSPNVTTRARDVVRGLIGSEPTTKQSTLPDVPPVSDRNDPPPSDAQVSSTLVADSTTQLKLTDRSDIGLEPTSEHSPTTHSDTSVDPDKTSSDDFGSRNDSAGGRDTFEDRAQADARSSVVSEDELPPYPAKSMESNGHILGQDEVSSQKPDLQQLREELRNEFESIRIVERGQYELNLMELYERKECIIELQENGRYVIQVPETLEMDPA